MQLKLLTRNDFNFRDLAIREIKYLIKENIIKEAQKITNYKLLKNDFSWYSPGIRPQLYNIEKNKLEMDFVVNEEHNRIHILNSISPAWTCSFKTAKEIMKLVRKKIN